MWIKGPEDDKFRAHPEVRPSMPLHNSSRPTTRAAETLDSELAPKSAPLAAPLHEFLASDLPRPRSYEHTGATPLPELAPLAPEPDPFPRDRSSLPPWDGKIMPPMTFEREPAGRKDDGGKIPLDLLPFDALEEVGKVLAFGARKYARRNWERGIPLSRVLAATLRHVFAYARGEDNDPETGLSHLAHAGCEILFALAFECRGRTDLDDRKA